MSSRGVNIVLVHEELTVIPKKPTIADLQKLQREVYANASGVPALDGTAHGFVGLIMSPAAFLLINNNVAYVPPVAPARDAPAGGTAIVQAQAFREHTQRVDEFRQYTYMYTTLKNQVIKAVQPVYLLDLEDPITGLSTQSPWQLISHLLTTYGTITDDDIQANRTKLVGPWNPDDPIETIFARGNACQKFAADANAAISDRELVAALFQVLVASGVLSYVCTVWNARLQATKTLIEFKTHFLAANTLRASDATAQSTGYHGAHAVTPTKPGKPTIGATADKGTVHADGGTTMYYCHSCGIGFNPKHTSATCTQKKAGHQELATMHNRMKGETNLFNARTHRKPPVIPTKPEAAAAVDEK
jgi:hypothetical protein